MAPSFSWSAIYVDSCLGTYLECPGIGRGQGLGNRHGQGHGHDTDMDTHMNIDIDTDMDTRVGLFLTLNKNLNKNKVEIICIPCEVRKTGEQISSCDLHGRAADFSGHAQ
jgi:hypothetical protein